MRAKLNLIICLALVLSQFKGFGEIDFSVKAEVDSIRFCNADSSICFGGTVEIPNPAKRNPVVIFVSGTGKQDRDGTMAGDKMFKTIADSLAGIGVASLRTDDRGVGETTGVYEVSTTADFASDVLAAIAYLKTRSDIDSTQIGLIGHSEGGAVIGIVASESTDVAFLVSLAGLATNGLESLKKQNRDIVEHSALPDYDKRRSSEINELMFDTAYRYADSDSMEHKLNETYARWKQQDDEYFKTLDIEFDHFRFPIYSYVRIAIGPWYRYFLKYDPEKFLTKVDIPVLALNGDRDLMVACDENLANWKKFLEKGGNTDVTVVKLPCCDHLFHQCSTSDSNAVKEGFSADALHILEKWILNHLR